MLLLMASLGLALAGDAPEISRSAGEPGGVVLLWPRVIPSSRDQVPRSAAWQVQKHLEALLAEAAPGRPVDVRPEPERVCPKAGCEGISVGALVVHQGEACVVVGLVSGPGREPATLVPWAGQVDLKASTVPFREPPESSVTIRDFARCDALLEPLRAGDEAMKRAISAALGAP